MATQRQPSGLADDIPEFISDTVPQESRPVEDPNVVKLMAKRAKYFRYKNTVRYQPFKEPELSTAASDAVAQQILTQLLEMSHLSTDLAKPATHTSNITSSKDKLTLLTPFELKVQRLCRADVRYAPANAVIAAFSAEDAEVTSLAYTIAIKYFTSRNKGITSYVLMQHMWQNGLTPDQTIFNLLLGMYARQNNSKAFQMYLALMAKHQIQCDGFTWGSLITLFLRINAVATNTAIKNLAESASLPGGDLVRSICLNVYCDSAQGLPKAVEILHNLDLRKKNLVGPNCLAVVLQGMVTRKEYDEAWKLMRTTCTMWDTKPTPVMLNIFLKGYSLERRLLQVRNTVRNFWNLWQVTPNMNAYITIIKTHLRSPNPSMDIVTLITRHALLDYFPRHNISTLHKLLSLFNGRPEYAEQVDLGAWTFEQWHKQHEKMFDYFRFHTADTVLSQGDWLVDHISNGAFHPLITSHRPHIATLKVIQEQLQVLFEQQIESFQRCMSIFRARKQTTAIEIAVKKIENYGSDIAAKRLKSHASQIVRGLQSKKKYPGRPRSKGSPM